MAQDGAESIRENNYFGMFINPFQPDIIKSVQQLEKINQKIYLKSLLSSIKYIIYIY